MKKFKIGQVKQFFSARFFFFNLLVFSTVLLFFSNTWAVEEQKDQDIEKPKPTFTKEGDKIVAKYIPRAKSNSISVDFAVSKGKLLEVKALEFEGYAGPEVYSRDFRSALFGIEIGDPTEETKLLLTSDFITNSTEFWIYRGKTTPAWLNTNADNQPDDGRDRTLIISVKDGGQFDADGQVNGRVLIIGGPKDSFWGYAIGTLFIRFFGIFIVLGILQIGMNISAFIFTTLDKKKQESAKESEEPTDDIQTGEHVESPIEDAPVTVDAVDRQDEADADEIAAVITTTLQLYADSVQKGTVEVAQPKMVITTGSNPWAQSGRQGIMAKRQNVFQR